MFVPREPVRRCTIHNLRTREHDQPTTGARWNIIFSAGHSFEMVLIFECLI